MTTPKGWRKINENKVSILKQNRHGDRYGEVLAWEWEGDEDYYVTVFRDAEGDYDILKGFSRDSREQRIVASASTKSEGRKKAVAWMDDNPSPF